MFKNGARSQQFRTRSASFSTRPKANGLNLLGWGEREELSDEQKREALRARLRQLEDGISLINQTLVDCVIESDRTKLREKKAALAVEIPELHSALVALRKTEKKEFSDLSILEAAKPLIGERLVTGILDTARKQLELNVYNSSSQDLSDEKTALLSVRDRLSDEIKTLKNRQQTTFISDFGKHLDAISEKGLQLQHVQRRLSNLKSIPANKIAAETLAVDMLKREVGVVRWKLIIQEARKLTQP